MENKWKQIGTCGVDSGLIMLGDPCYSLHRISPYEEFGETWESFCDILDERDINTKNFINIGEGIAMIVNTLYGDGEYPVYAKYQDGRISQIKIDFRGE